MQNFIEAVEHLCSFRFWLEVLASTEKCNLKFYVSAKVVILLQVFNYHCHKES